MAYLSHHMSFPMRSANKEPLWASVYDDLFDQCIDTDHFTFGDTTTSNSSDEVSNETSKSLEGFANSSDSNSSSARRASDDFWTRTLQNLEESASSIEQSEQRKRQTPPPGFYTKDPFHSDFLSLGGFPSPHISSSPSAQASPSEQAAARRRRAAIYHHQQQAEHQNRRTNNTERRRPVGVTKTYHRSGSKSPNNMMTPSRYRAGFRDVWAENIRRAPGMMVNLPKRSLPLSPPSSGGKHMMVSAQFCSLREIDAAPFQQYTQYDEQISPLSSTFPQAVHATLHTPNSSPLTTPGIERGTVFGENNINNYYEPVSLNRTSWAANSFDVDNIYEPSPTFSPWLESERRQSAHYSGTNRNSNYVPLSTSTSMPDMHSQQPTSDLATSGLMITYDPTLVPSQEEETNYSVSPLATDPVLPYYTTESHSRNDSTTPSPPSNRKSRSHTRKSSGQASPRRKTAAKSAFVNYTPSDSEKLLTGVAPSGSSKTKARREREAAENRRRFSQAAVKAVAAAGGDVEQLRYAGVY